jgi:hypothetical protein
MIKRHKGLRFLVPALALVMIAGLLLANQSARASYPAAPAFDTAAQKAPPSSGVPGNDGFDALPTGLKGISYSTLTNLGLVHPAPPSKPAGDSGWKNPFSPLVNVVWGAAIATSGSAGEPAAGMHPSDPNKALVSGNFSLDNTTNGGTSWQTRNPPNACGSGDVVNVWLGPSTAGGNGALETCLNGSPIDFTCGRSTDGGVTWTADAGCGSSVSTVFFDDRQYMWVDRNPASPFFQRVYLTEAIFDSGGTGSYNSITLRWSSNAGTSWNPPGSNPLPIVNAGEFAASQNHNEFPSMGIQPNGTIGLAWHRGMCCGGPSPINAQNKVMFARSTDGGVTFPFSTTVVTVALNQTVPFNSTSPLGVRWSDAPNITADPANGTFYATWIQYRTASTPASSAAYVAKSTDNGVTWSTPVIAFNNPNPNIFQGWPWLAVSQDHTVHLTYLGGTTTNTAVAQFYVQSTDNGTTWSAPFQLSTGTFGAFGTTTDYEANDVGGYSGSNATILTSWATNTHFARMGIFTIGTPTPTATPCSPVPCTSTPTNTPTFTWTPTNTFTPTSTNTPTPTPNTCGPNSNYTIAQTSGAIIDPGTTDIGNHSDDLVTTIALPFTYNFYNSSFTSANVSSNGNLQFTTANTAFTNACLPTATLSNAILPHWDDLRTDAQTNCSAFASGCGIFTSVSGVAPTRIFNIEWRAVLFTGGTTVNFEVRLYEGQNRFDLVYGTVNGTGSSATVGVQRDTGSLFTQFSCNTASLSTGLQLAFSQAPCGSPVATLTFTPVPPTLTPTRTPTITFTRTPSITATNTGTNTPISTATFTPVPTNTPTSTVNPNLNAYAYLSLPVGTPAPLGPITITVGSRLDMDLRLNAGTNDITAGQSYITFTNSLIQNVNVTATGCVVTSTFTFDSSTFDAVLQNEVCNGPGNCTFRGVTVGPGSMAFASGALSSCPSGCGGDFRVAQVALCATAVGNALLHWQFAPPDPLTRDSEIVDVNGGIVNNRALYSDLVIHIVAQSNLVGHVTWQGRPAQPNALQALPITLTLKLGGAETNYSSLTTDASGFFTVPVTGLPNGTYSWRVKGPDAVLKTLATDPPGFLANSGTVALSGALSTSQEMGLMRAGDCNNDNIINISDFNILKNSFGRASGSPGYDNRADFNGDSVVNIQDFNLQKGNFGIPGSPPLSFGGGSVTK